MNEEINQPQLDIPDEYKDDPDLYRAIMASLNDGGAAETGVATNNTD